MVSGILTMQSFGVAFPRIYLDSGFKGWFVSTLLLGMIYAPLLTAIARINVLKLPGSDLL